MKKLLAALVVLASMVLIAPEAMAIVNLEGRYWFPTLDSDIKVTSGSVIGTDIDVVDDLGLDKRQNFPEGRITLELGRHRLRYGYTQFRWDTTEALTKTIVFDGTTYSASTSVKTDLEVDYHRLGYQFDIFDFAGNHVGLIAELKYFDMEATLEGGGSIQGETIRAPIPTVGVSASAGLPFLFGVEGEVTGVALGSDIYMYDAEAAVVLKPAPFVKIAGGYRILKFHIENDDDRAEIDLNGPYLMVRVDF